MAITITPATENRIIVACPYNATFTIEAKRAGGAWSPRNKAWVFPAEQTGAVRKILFDIFGEDDRAAPGARRVRLRCIYDPNPSEQFAPTWPDTGGHLEIVLAGREVARAFGRDSGARLGLDVVIIAGDITSGGSRNNPRIAVARETIVDLLRVPEPMARRMVAERPAYFRIVADDGAELEAGEDTNNVTPIRPATGSDRG